MEDKQCCSHQIPDWLSNHLSNKVQIQQQYNYVYQCLDYSTGNAIFFHKEVHMEQNTHSSPRPMKTMENNEMTPD